MQWMTSENDLNEALLQSQTQPIVVFKHSTQCPISAAAHRQMESFAANATTPIYLIRVIEERPLSNLFAERCQVRHQSPQTVILKSGKVVWQASHYDITAKSVESAINAD